MRVRFPAKCIAGCAALLSATEQARAQQPDVLNQVQQLRQAIAVAQQQLEQSQHQLDELKHQMDALQKQMAMVPAPSPDRAPVDQADVARRDREDEREAVQESQLATLEQSKVESDSKYPLRISGMVLANIFANAENAGNVASPSVAIAGSGSTVITLRQTVLGLDGRGPHLFGGKSYADLRMDFSGAGSQNLTNGIYSGGYGVGTSLLRLRTAHAGIDWPRVEAYFSLDRPIINPESPTSIAAVAEPALSWSGNLWMWSPQIGVRADVPVAKEKRLIAEAALIDVLDAPLTPSFYATVQGNGPNSNEASRWPGAEARLGWASGRAEHRNSAGIGGFFASHRYPSHRMDSWAATADFHLSLPARLELSGDIYRGLGLGGLGGGAFKDYAVRSYGAYSDFTGFDDVGGWGELKERLSERLQFNLAYGTDQLFAGQLRAYLPVLNTVYQRLARTQTYTANTIFSPSAYLLFSLEYRHILSSPITGSSADTNTAIVSAGYRF